MNEPPLIEERNSKSLKNQLMPTRLPAPLDAVTGNLKCDKSQCWTFQQHLVEPGTFRSERTGEVFTIRHRMTCDSSNIVYLCCDTCNHTQYIGETRTNQPTNKTTNQPTKPNQPTKQTNKQNKTKQKQKPKKKKKKKKSEDQVLPTCNSSSNRVCSCSPSPLPFEQPLIHTHFSCRWSSYSLELSRVTAFICQPTKHLLCSLENNEETQTCAGSHATIARIPPTRNALLQY